MNWEKPKLIENSMIELNIDQLPNRIANITNAISKSFQVPMDFSLLVLCSVIAAATRGKISIKVKADWHEPLAIYAAPLLAPSNRKSGVLGILTKPLRDIQKELRSDHFEIERGKALDREVLLARKQELLKKSKSGLKSDLQAEIADLDLKLAQCKEARTPSLLIDDTTPEALVEALCDQKSLAYIEAEGQLIDNTSRYSDNQTPNIEALNKAYSGEPISVSRKGKDLIFNDKPHLVICIGAQPNNVIPKIKNEAFLSSGFAARFIYSVPKSQIGSRKFDSPQIPEMVKLDWRELVQQLYKLGQSDQDRVLTLTPEALSMVEQTHDWLEPQLLKMDHNLQNWAGKLLGNLIRLAGIFALSENPRGEQISQETMSRALALAPLFLQEAAKVFSPDTSEQPAVRVLRKLTQGFKGFEVVDPINGNIFLFNKLFQNMKDQAWLSKSFKPSGKLSAVLWQLEELGWVIQLEVEQSGVNGGRPSEKWQLHPEAETYFAEIFGA